MTDHVKIYGVKPRIQYVADGSLTEYTFPFAIFSANDVDIYFDGEKQESTTYTVSGARQSDGGSVTFASAPTAGTVITIVRQLSIERTTDFQEGSALRAQVLNDELDYQTACQQQIAEALNRSMLLPPYAAADDVNLTLPPPSAGKAIVWNAEGTNLENSTVAVNALESTINTYKTQAQEAANTATSKASAAATQAQTATIQAAIATQKAGEIVGAVNGLNGLRTNCLTEIPQDIKLELSSGTLTMKAGSKYYLPDGTRKEIDSDKSVTISNVDAQWVIFSGVTNGSINNYKTLSKVGSGATLPADGNTYAAFFNTTDGKIYQWSGGQWGEWSVSLPIAIVTTSGNHIASIDQVFNGFGYMGSTLFVLPGVKGLIPDGRNTDGTVKNAALSITGLLTKTVSGTASNKVLIIKDDDLDQDTVTYDEKTNTNSVAGYCMAGYCSMFSGKVTMLDIKRPFRAADT